MTNAGVSKKNKALCLLLCAAMLLPCGCARRNPQAVVQPAGFTAANTPVVKGEYTFSLQADSGGIYPIPTLIRGLQFGMTVQQAGEVMDYTRGDFDTDGPYQVYKEYYNDRSVIKRGTYRLFDRDVKGIKLYFSRSFTYGDFTLDQGLVKVEILLNKDSASILPTVISYFDYNANDANAVFSNTETHFMYGGNQPCEPAIALLLTQREQLCDADKEQLPELLRQTYETAGEAEKRVYVSLFSVSDPQMYNISEASAVLQSMDQTRLLEQFTALYIQLQQEMSVQN